jgi:hypothetical protein
MRQNKLFIPADEVTTAGSYQLDMCDGEGIWMDITVYERNGKLFLVNPENFKECCLNGIIGWLFLKNTPRPD